MRCDGENGVFTRLFWVYDSDHRMLDGYNAAMRLLQVNGARDISIGSIRGFLTDHYNPTRALVNLSEAALTYLASLLTALVLFLRFLIQVLTLFGRKDYMKIMFLI